LCIVRGLELKIGAFSVIGGSVLLGLFLFGLMQGVEGPVGQAFEYGSDQCLDEDEWVPVYFDVSSFAGQDVELEINHAICGDMCGTIKLDNVCVRENCPESAIDTDGDGLEDKYDHCPESTTTIVNYEGCEDILEIMDSDEDGVFNDEDICNDTPPKDIVDSYGCTIIKGEEVVLYEFEGNALDSFHSVHGEVMPEAEFELGQVGLGLNGSVKVEDHHLLHLDEFTINFWIKPLTFTEGIIMMKNEAGFPSGFILHLQSDGSIKLCAQQCTTAPSLSLDTWNYVSIAYDGDIKIYYDGALQAEQQDFYIDKTDSDPFYINGRRNQVEFIDALIDQVRIISRAITQNEIIAFCYSEGGCGAIDTDQDGTIDTQDLCPTEYGDDNGCEAPIDEYTEIPPSFEGYQLYTDNGIFVSYRIKNYENKKTSPRYFTAIATADNIRYKSDPTIIRALFPGEEMILTYSFIGTISEITYVAGKVHDEGLVAFPEHQMEESLIYNE